MVAAKCVMVEACSDDDAGSIGPYYVAHHARKAGHQVDEARTTKAGYDVELISVHHADDFVRLANMPKRAAVRIVGGHVMQNNPRPAIPWADVVFIGEAEHWIGPALSAVAAGGVDALAGMPGTILSRDWRPGNTLPPGVFLRPLPDNPPYLNRPGTLSAAWYVEMARGCPFSCAYCELGHSSPARIYPAEQIKKTLDACDLSQTRKINFYAPDEASHPDWNELYGYVYERGFLAGFSSMRVDQVLRQRPQLKANTLVRVGVDGLSEEIRFRVGKKISDAMLIDYFGMMLAAGHVQFKMFEIFNYPFEEAHDFAAYEHLMRRIFALPMAKNVSLRIKWTPFIPQPVTPLAKAMPSFDRYYERVRQISTWHALERYPRREPGWWVKDDGIMSIRSYKRQVALTVGNEAVIQQLGMSQRAPLHPKACGDAHG